MKIRNLMVTFFLITIFSTAAYSSNNMSLQERYANVCKSQSFCKWENGRCFARNDHNMDKICENKVLSLAMELQHEQMKRK